MRGVNLDTTLAGNEWTGTESDDGTERSGTFVSIVWAAGVWADGAEDETLWAEGVWV